MVQSWKTPILLVWLACLVAVAAVSQDAPPAQRPAHQFFAGFVTALSDTQITVSRTVLGNRTDTRTFLITEDTRIDGRPKVKSRVTVQFEADGDGNRAVHIMVRNSPKKQ